MAFNNFTANQGTQTAILTDNTGGSGTAGTVIAVQKVDISAAGTAGTLWNGNVGVSSGTITTLPNLPGGSVTVTGGTVNTGTINTGTINLGTVVGKDANAAAQTGNPLAFGGTDSGGTIRTAKVDANGLQRTLQEAGTITILPNLPQGSINVTAGTVNAGTINTGTINAGTINAGTINAGTFRADGRTTQNIVTYGTQLANAGASAATIVGSAAVGAGTSLWVQDMSIINPNANVMCILGFGTAQQGTNVLFRGSLGTAGAAGIEKAYGKAVNAGMTNQDLVFSTTGAGTVDLALSYFISA